jgi:transposase InsO family protein
VPWQEQSTVSLRTEFVTLAGAGAISFAELCRRYGISRQTGYKWLNRYRTDGAAGLVDQSRRPHRSPSRTDPDVESAVSAVRQQFPTWGGRKIGAYLRHQGMDGVPPPSTITEILRRADLLTDGPNAAQGPWQRFVHPAPNDLWQLDFKGHFPLASGRCHPLTVLDDHSRYALGLVACANQQSTTVQAHLAGLFRRYGMPWTILTDNGPPWGSTQPRQPLTRLGVWLIRLGISVCHSRPYHPQTSGKIERFHRTLKTDLLQDYRYRSLTDTQAAFDTWRHTYNHIRPHDALDLTVPAQAYQSSLRPFPESLPELTYAETDIVRSVRTNGYIHYQSREYLISLALVGQPIALRPTLTDGIFTVRFAHHHLGELNLHSQHFTMHYGRSLEV